MRKQRESDPGCYLELVLAVSLSDPHNANKFLYEYELFLADTISKFTKYI